MFTTLAFLLLAPLVSYPALAAPPGDPRVIAVHTASAPRVSMVLAVPAAQHDLGLAPEALSVTVNGRPVTTTVTPMASRSLSVALVIDTASDMPPEVLEAAQSGATEFLLRLPEGVRTMVVASGGDPRVVAPLSPEPADALSAVSALRSGGTRSTTAGTLLAAQKLAMAPPGPRAIIVYSHGSDERGPSVEQLSQAVARAEAVINVVQTRGDDLWSQVVDRTGGAVLRTDTAQVVQSYGHLATALGEQYLVAFQAPGELPAVAEVAVKTGDVQSRTVVRLPEAGTSADAAKPPSGRWPAGLGPISIVLSGFVLIALAALALDLRSHRRASVDSGAPSAGAAGPHASTTFQAPARAMPGKTERRHPPPPDGAPPSAPPTAPATSPLPRRPVGRPFPGAAQGLRSAPYAPGSQREQQARRHPPHDQQQWQRSPDDNQPRTRALDRVLRRAAVETSAERPPATLPSGIGSRMAAAAAAAAEERSAEEGHNATIVLTGSTDAVVKFAKNAPGPAVVYITGNAASSYFGVRILGTEHYLVNTLHPYDGVRSLDRDGGESTGFEVRATGLWRIEVLPLSVIPSFNTSFKGDGDMVVRYTGDGSLAEITGNNHGRYFDVRAFGAHGTDHLVSTSQPYAGSRQISRGPQFFEVQAVGSWTITVK
ncbi:MAG TPA: VWA domain-containing protein [Acidimicrobiales bacterium]|nr:VWA domain-containing protein [Acidimicrobiales bacterium]